MLKTLFESIMNRINARMDDLEKSVSDIKASLEFSQTEIEDLKPLRPKLKEAEENLITVHNSVLHAGMRAYFILDCLIIRDKISSDQEAGSSSRE